MKVRWTNAALAQLGGIHQYIARDSAQYATRMVDRITARSKQIASFPKSAVVVAEYGDSTVREVLEGPYRMIYRIEADGIDVLAVIHGAQPLPPEPPSNAR